MECVFVTGATGLLGRNVVLALLERGVRVRALVRSMEKARVQFGAQPPEGLILVKGDVTEPEGFADELVGCDALIHTAAYFRESFSAGEHWDRLVEVNVEGTRALLQRAHEAGVRRIVHVSSIAVLRGTPHHLVDETMRRDPETTRDDYYRSKILSDRVVREHLDAHPDAWAVFVLPGWMHGPGDLGPTSAGQFTLDYMKGRLPGIPESTIAFVDARDVAHAVLRSLERGQRGHSYLAAGESMWMREVAELYQRVTDVSAPRLRFPTWFMLVYAYMSEAFARWTGGEPVVGVATVEMLRDEVGQHAFDHTRSTEELGLEFRPHEETVRDEVAWYEAQGML